MDICDISHSKKFPQKFSKTVQIVLKRRIRNFLKKPLVQTGLRPPLKIVADKAIYKHWSRNLTGVITIVPGAPKLIQGIFLDATPCNNSSGDALTDNIEDTGIKDYEACLSQVTGTAGDGLVLVLAPR